MKKVILQFLKFIGVSGIGWIMDFCAFSLLTSFFNLSVIFSNIISSFIAITFVFSVSTKKIFANSKRLNLKIKFLIYVLYQIILILVASMIMGYLASVLMSVNVDIISKFAKILSKILITPFTMMLNYIVMKYLIERM